MALLLYDKKILILTPNKCASTTVITTLCAEVNAQAILTPQGPWRTHQDYPDDVGKHGVIIPHIAKNWSKYLIYRDPIDRFISLWKHYCRYHSHEVTFEQFVTLVEQWRVNPPQNWFYCWRMMDIINETPKDVKLIPWNRLELLNDVFGVSLTFPKLHATDHKEASTYLTTNLYRRVVDIA